MHGTQLLVEAVALPVSPSGSPQPGGAGVAVSAPGSLAAVAVSDGQRHAARRGHVSPVDRTCQLVGGGVLGYRAGSATPSPGHGRSTGHRAPGAADRPLARPD